MRILIPIVAFAVSSAGWWFEHLERVAEVATINTTYAKERANEATAALDRLKVAQARGDALETQLAASESARETTKQETSREIARLTTGRACLGSAVVSLLNQPTGLRLGSMPQPTSEPASADDSVATDTDVGLWINNAKSKFDQCRDKLQALIDWHAPK